MKTPSPEVLAVKSVRGSENTVLSYWTRRYCAAHLWIPPFRLISNWKKISLPMRDFWKRLRDYLLIKRKAKSLKLFAVHIQKHPPPSYSHTSILIAVCLKNPQEVSPKNF